MSVYTHLALVFVGGGLLCLIAQMLIDAAGAERIAVVHQDRNLVRCQPNVKLKSVNPKLQRRLK